jgi:hypothetical protein
MNCRYDSQIAVFGREFQQRLGDQSWFLVGGSVKPGLIQ